MATMSPFELKYNYEKHNPDGEFFNSSNLKFFGERWSEMRVLKNTTTITDCCNEKHECYVLSSLQRNAPGGAKRAYHYFDVNTFEIVHFPN